MATTAIYMFVASFLISTHIIGSHAALSDCTRKCGNLTIPYPFWIDNQASCGFTEFYINCSANGTAFFQTDYGASFEVLDISSGNLTIDFSDFKANVICHDTDFLQPSHANLAYFGLTSRLGHFFVSGSNVFVGLGCNTISSIVGNNSVDPEFNFSCQAGCTSGTEPFPFCYGIGCCLASVPSGLTQFNVTSQLIEDAEEWVIYANVSCGFSTLLQPSSFKVNESTDQSESIGGGQSRLAIAWGMLHDDEPCSGNKCCYEACDNHAFCNLTEGNSGVYFCNCAEGFIGDGFKNGTGCKRIPPPPPPPPSPPLSSPTNSPSNLLTRAILSTGVSVALLGFVLFWMLKSGEVRRRKQRYFRLHGGPRLQELSERGNVTPKLFSEKELEKATQNFSDDMKLGSGGFGTVYKGEFEDGSVVAIKKSNHIQQPGEVDQFLNEIILLSSINHRNIVRLVGCCLEAQVPLLVYEYIPNATLMEHLQGKFGASLSSWEMRLQIACQTADALAYLHSAASPSIIHRDVKSSNVLLDENFTPKVGDFGVSRQLEPNQTHVSTAVLGTYGYLDPQYFLTFQLTDKSDVYSFGVVLLELITSRSPVSMGGNLASLCTSRVAIGEFSELIDPHLNILMGSQEITAIGDVAELATSCLAMDGQDRPSMRDVADKLHSIQSRSSKGEPVCLSNSYDARDDPEEEDDKQPFRHYNLESSLEIELTTASVSHFLR